MIIIKVLIGSQVISEGVSFYNIQQEYSARFRDDEQIKTLFTKFASTDKPEVINMNKLFYSKM